VCELFHESAHLVQAERGKIVYIDNVTDATQSLRIRQYIGRTAPMYCTGVGKLFMTEFSEAQMEDYVRDNGLPRLTEYTLCTKEDLLQAVEFSRRYGYALDNQECEIGVRCVAVPVRDFSGKIVAGLSISGPTSRVTDEAISSKLPPLLDIAHRASCELGYSGERVATGA